MAITTDGWALLPARPVIGRQDQRQVKQAADGKYTLQIEVLGAHDEVVVLKRHRKKKMDISSGSSGHQHNKSQHAEQIVMASRQYIPHIKNQAHNWTHCTQRFTQARHGPAIGIQQTT